MPMRIITFKIDDELLERLDLVAQRVGATRSELIRKAIIMYITKLENQIQPQKPRIRIIE